jgi:hypothetical protein
LAEEQKEIFLGSHNELVYGENGKLLEEVQLRRGFLKNQIVEESFVKKDGRGRQVSEEEVKYYYDEANGNIFKIIYKKMKGDTGENVVDNLKKAIEYDSKQRIKSDTEEKT